MTDVNVLIVFYSRYGEAEQLALVAGVGALQERANIRLRRVVDLAAPATIDADPRWKENLARMNRDYVAPREVDAVWADALVLVTPCRASAEMRAFVRGLRSASLGPETIAAPLATRDDEEVLRSLYSEAACSGMLVVPGAGDSSSDALTRGRLHGRRVTAMARVLKARL